MGCLGPVIPSHYSSSPAMQWLILLAAGICTLAAASLSSLQQDLYLAKLRDLVDKALHSPEPLAPVVNAMHTHRRVLNSKKLYTGGTVDESRWQVVMYATLTKLVADIKGSVQVCEAGFNVGMSAAMWLAASDRVRLQSFDLCEWQGTGSRAGGRLGSRRLKGVHGDRFDLICGDTKATIPKFVQGDGAAGPAAGAGGAGGHCDIIHIDAGHDYEDAAADLVNAWGLANRSFHVLLVDDTNCDIGFCSGPNAAWRMASGEVAHPEVRAFVASVYAYRRCWIKGFSVGGYLFPTGEGRPEAHLPASMPQGIPKLNLSRVDVASCEAPHGEIEGVGRNCIKTRSQAMEPPRERARPRRTAAAGEI